MKEQSENNSDVCLNNVTNRLDAIIRLLIAQLNSKQDYEMKKIYSMLSESGLSSGEIGKIVNKPSKDISSTINKIKKEKLDKNG